MCASDERDDTTAAPVAKPLPGANRAAANLPPAAQGEPLTPEILPDADFAPLGERERAFVAMAASYLERPGFLVRMTGMLGRPAEMALRALPPAANRVIARSTHKALQAGLKAALYTLPRHKGAPGEQPVEHLYTSTFQSGAVHTAAGYFTGFTGGLLGLPALPIELPLTTAIMLRSIADIAARMGHDVRDPAVQLECLAVLGLGHTQSPAQGLQRAAGAAIASGEAEPGYYAVRTSMVSAVGSAARWIAGATPGEVVQAVMKGRAPAVARLLAAIANRFNVVVAQKTVLQIVPVLGAATGTAVNLAFLDHFNQVARLHFGLQLLEQRFGEAAVRQAYAEETAAMWALAQPDAPELQAVPGGEEPAKLR